jgi:putative endonuclease
MSRVSNTPYVVYVLWGETGQRFYIGVTENLYQRLAQHNQGLSRWTARYRPWLVVFEQTCADYTAARRLENELKRQKGGNGFYALTGLNANRFHNGLPSRSSGS